jgi:AraC-like DNA-binding protein
LIDIAGQIARLARRFGLQLHTGIAQAKSSESLPARYRAALWAAEKAVSQGLAVAYGESQSESSTERLWNLRNDLGKSVGERPELLSPRFDRYIEVVLAHSGYRLDAVKTHLGSGFERLAGSLLGGGFLDRKGFTDLCASVELAEEAARTVADLVASYRRLVSEIAAVQRSPVTARQDHGTQAALAFIAEHLGEPLTVERVARAAGYAPDYFAKVFKRSERVTVARYLHDLRIARAREMLTRTNMTIEQIQGMCGFSTRPHFHRAFKNSVGMTPIAYRKGSRPRVPREHSANK